MPIKKSRRPAAFTYLLLAALFSPAFGSQKSTGQTRKASIVLTATEDGLESQSEFFCSGKIHGYILLPERAVGEHVLQGIWTGADGRILQQNHIPINFPEPGRSTAYLWLAFPQRPSSWSLDPEAEKERLSYNGAWRLDVRWDEKPLLSSTFTVHCQ